MVLYSEKSNKLRKKVSFLLPAGSQHENVDRLRLKSPAGDSSRPGPVKCNSSHYNKKKSKHKNESEVEPKMSRSRINTKVKKSFVRNSEMPVGFEPSNAIGLGLGPSTTYSGRPPTRRQVGSILKKTLVSDSCLSQYDKDYKDHQDYKSKFSAPELYSSLRIGQKIQSSVLEQTKSGSVSVNLSDVRKGTKHHIEEKAASKLNFPFEEQVYRDLVTLNVCDEDIFGRDGDKCGCSNEYDSPRSKEHEPILADFHEPKFSGEYASVSKPLTCKVEKVRRYNGLAVYNKMQQWERSD